MSLLSSMVDVSELFPQNKCILSAPFYGNFKKRVIRVPEDKARTVLCQKVQKRTPKVGVKIFVPFVANVSYFRDTF